MKEHFINHENIYEIERLKKFELLRHETHAAMEKEIKRRIKSNSIPSEEEVLVGAFHEMIEPQVRDAVFKFFRKGYTTHSSGFGGEYGEIQSMSGYFEIDKKTKEKLKNLGVLIQKGKDVGLPGYGEYYTFLQFKPINPDLKEITKIWDKITTLLPDLKHFAMPSISGGAEDFRKKYAPERTDIEKVVIEKHLQLEKFHPDVERVMLKRLKELQKNTVKFQK